MEGGKAWGKEVEMSLRPVTCTEVEEQGADGFHKPVLFKVGSMDGAGLPHVTSQ